MFQLSDIIIVVLGLLVGLGIASILTASGKAELMLENVPLSQSLIATAMLVRMKELKPPRTHNYIQVQMAERPFLLPFQLSHPYRQCMMRVVAIVNWRKNHLERR
jgi:hypothetical protein